jgi:tRNA pseudouridine13 synthase
MNVSQAERRVGILTHLTSCKGIGGRIEKADDFFVEEVSSFVSSPPGKYLIIEVEKKNWDTYELIHELSRKLHISRKRFSFAGLKDKRAHTKQKMSIYGIDWEDLAGISLPGVKIKLLGRSMEPLKLGELEGNLFRLNIRTPLPHEEARRRMERITEEVKGHGGFPNFFGIQRFGSRRPVTHEVGEKIVKGKYKEAAMTYIAKPFDDESEDMKKARRYIWETQDFKDGIKILPLRNERAMMEFLLKNPEDWRGSFSVLPKNLRNLFVHAYQSYIFNLLLSERIKGGLPVGEALPGDIVLFKNGKYQFVYPETAERINRFVKKGEAWVTLPLIGYESILAKGKQGDVERKILAELMVKPSDFRAFGSKGTRRKIAVKTDVSFDVRDGKVSLSFFLERGGYATVVAREYMK